MNFKSTVISSMIRLLVSLRRVKTSQDGFSVTTSVLCERLFQAMGSAVSIQDIDTAHRVPTRNTHRGGPEPIIC